MLAPLLKSESEIPLESNMRRSWIDSMWQSAIPTNSLFAGGAHALRNVAVDYRRGVAQAEWERRRGVLSEVCQGERLSSGELCHDVDKRKSEVT
jgi:hypothetical protein